MTWGSPAELWTEGLTAPSSLTLCAKYLIFSALWGPGAGNSMISTVRGCPGRAPMVPRIRGNLLMNSYPGKEDLASVMVHMSKLPSEPPERAMLLRQVARLQQGLISASQGLWEDGCCVQYKEPLFSLELQSALGSPGDGPGGRAVLSFPAFLLDSPPPIQRWTDRHPGSLSLSLGWFDSCLVLCLCGVKCCWLAAPSVVSSTSPITSKIQGCTPQACIFQGAAATRGPQVGVGSSHRVSAWRKPRLLPGLHKMWFMPESWIAFFHS
jgi:hypothetical protein